MPLPETPLPGLSCAASRTIRSRGGSAPGGAAPAAVRNTPAGPEAEPGLDYDRCHDPCSNTMTSVMMTQGPNAPPLVVAEVTVLPPAVSDTDALLAMLGRCSRASLFHRFHGVTDGVAYFAALLRARPDDQTLLDWASSTCVGVATISAGATGHRDLGFLVAAAWERRGIGTHIIAS